MGKKRYKKNNFNNKRLNSKSIIDLKLKLKGMKKVCLMLMLFFGIALIGNSQTVRIGSQVWTTKNLNVSTFRNGDVIPEAKTYEEWINAGLNKKAAWCYFNNDAANGTKYGKLYNWYAVNDARGLAPIGYHIPSDAEWTKLGENLGRKRSGKKMKSKMGWISKGNGNNKSGFSGLPGGFRFDYGRFYDISKTGYWWSSTGIGTSYGYYHYLSYDGVGKYRNDTGSAYGLSVRCIRD